MRLIRALTVIAAVSMDSAAQDLVFEHRRRGVGSNGVRRTKDGDELPHLVKAILEDEEEGDGVGLKDEVVVVVMNGDDEEQIVADLIDLNDNGKESSHSRHPTIVKRAKEAKETTETKRKKETSKKTRSKKSSEDASVDSDNSGVHEFVIDSTLDVCPPSYSVSVTYKAGDIIESHLNIWECQAAPYEKYCSLELDKNWDEEKKELWHGSWVLIGTCEKQVAKENSTKVRQFFGSSIIAFFI